MDEEKNITTYNKLENVINNVKRYWGKYTAFFIGASVIVMFASSIIFKQRITVQMMNNWVGIILGLIATMMSIISLFLSFYNLEREREESNVNRELTHGLELLLKEVQDSQREVKNIVAAQAKDTEQIKENLFSKGKVNQVESSHNTADDGEAIIQALSEKIERGKDE